MSPCETSARAGPAGAPGRGVRVLPAARRRRRSSARRSTWARARSWSSAATRRRRASRFGVATTSIGRLLHAHRPAVLRRRRARGSRSSRRVRAAPMAAAGFWDGSRPTGSCLDCELMPWSAKAQELLRQQYAAVGAAARAGAREPMAALARGRGGDGAAAAARALPARVLRRRPSVTSTAYRRYCWPVASVDDLRLAPFHLLASEGAVHIDKNHVWHMERSRRLRRRQTPSCCRATPHRVVDLDRPESEVAAATRGGGAHRRGRRGHGRQAARLRRPRAARPGAAGGEVPRPRVPADHLRARVHRCPRTSSGCASAASAASARWRCASSRWASRRSSASSAASRCGACTSASSACWRWRASRSTRGSSSCRSRSRFRRPWRSGRGTAGSQTGRSGAGTR